MSLHAQQRQLPTCSSRTSRSNRHAVTAVPGLWPHARHPPTTFSLSQAGCAAQHRPKARLQPCRVASLDCPAVKPAEEGQQPAAGADSDSASTTGRMKQQSQAYLEQYVLPPAREVLQQYADVDALLVNLITTPDLDSALTNNPDTRAAATKVEEAVDAAVAVAYAVKPEGQSHVMEVGAGGEERAAHTFLQRVLYRINRLNHFWYDALSNYDNERSPWLAALLQRVERPWQAWEAAQLAAWRGEGLEGYQALGAEEVKGALRDRYHRDVDPPLSPALTYVKEAMSPEGYCHLLAVGALDGLVEASRQSRVCAGVANQPACTIFRVLLEEYGSGRYAKKHSTFYKTMMEELGLDAVPECYLDLVPWQALAGANHNFLLTERRRHYLRYAGGLTFFETNGPAVYRAYLGAAQRVGLSEGACGYWALHIKEDERHGRQMTEEVAVPLVDMYPGDAWELLWGYDQDLFMGVRSGAAIVRDIQAAEAAAGLLNAGQQ